MNTYYSLYFLHKTHQNCIPFEYHFNHTNYFGCFVYCCYYLIGFLATMGGNDKTKVIKKSHRIQELSCIKTYCFHLPSLNSSLSLNYLHRWFIKWQMNGSMCVSYTSLRIYILYVLGGKQHAYLSFESSSEGKDMQLKF